MISPYFQSPRRTPRRGNGKQKAAATILTAVASASFSPTASGSFVVPAPGSSASAATPPMKRTASTMVTPSPVASKKRMKTDLAAKPKKASLEPSSIATDSFEPIWSKQFSNQNPVPVHTLILGTHPSIKSLKEQQYYGHPMNAFWWIAGDCLGFRRATGVSESTGQPYQFTKDLWFGPETILSYDEQVQKLAVSGFALWDVVASCERKGSLDQSIQKETPNRIREFCQDHKSSLRRIVLANGGTGSKMFVKHFREWLESGELKVLADHEESQKAFGKAIQNGETKRAKAGQECSIEDDNKIVLVSAISVSPANARFSYAEKRDSWYELVYQPGLEHHRADGAK